ncbi:hypothetical protein Bca52824_049011 [Brassica carinata]|uniref:non-specific serine/threonine protein kinase n=1 Tax=Brassica carinata TaxID=52824 RepID=A0A8X7RK53_BRACI|nr:hypothetical protein Bca52824_049011 [Brassica carinata]
MLRESDGEMSLETANSPISSGTESCSSFSRLSFDTPPSTTATIPEEESFLSLKPHRSSDFAYAEIRRRRKHGLTFRDFRLMRRIGAGDIGTVYLCRLAGGEDDSRRSYFAMKVVDKEALALKKKMHRAEMEKKILKMLDHPFCRLSTQSSKLRISLASSWSIAAAETCTRSVTDSPTEDSPFLRQETIRCLK